MSDRICFVIAPIGKADTETRKRSDVVLDYIITPTVEPLGYRALRADKISEPGVITHQVIQHIVDDPLVIADLTDRNPNVFYELALRHALKRPVIQIIQKGEPIPFDVGGVRTIELEHTDLPNVEAVKKEIAEQIKALESQPEGQQNPISMSMDLKALKTSDKPQEKTMGEIVGMLTEIRAGMSSLQGGGQIGAVKKVQLQLLRVENQGLKSQIIRLQDGAAEMTMAANRVENLVRNMAAETSNQEKEATFQMLKEQSARLKEAASNLYELAHKIDTSEKLFDIT